MIATRRRAYGLVGLLLFCANAFVLAACLDSDFTPRPTPPPPTSNWTVEQARQFDEFPLYWLGESYHGLPLTSMRMTEATYELRDASFSRAYFFYGEPRFSGGDSGFWSAPLEVETYDVCEHPWESGWIDGEHPDAEEVAGVEIQGTKARLVRFEYEQYLKILTSNAEIHMRTWKAGFDIIKVAQDLIAIAQESGTTPSGLAPPQGQTC